ncbi:PAS domain-containing sensor histidine kinase [Ferruginibacter sp.]|nr:PAS domain S-box protein [Ferruginibacter sp.]
MKNQNIIQQSPDAIYTCDAMGFIKSYNKAAINLWGREPVVGKDQWCGSWRLLNKEGNQVTLDKHPMAMALKEGRLVHGDELIVQRPDGSLRHINPYSSPLVNEQGQLTGVVSMLMEISEQRDKEKQSEEKYRNFVEQAADGIFLIAPMGNFLSANTSGCSMLGYKRQALLKLNVKDVVPQQYAGKMLVSLDSLKTGNPVLVERQFLRKDGTVVYGELRIQPDSEGNIQAVVRDITERKRTEQSLLESKAFNQSILTSITSHIAVVDKSGTIVSVNKAWDDFSEKNGECALERTGVGSNYIEVCKKSVAAGEAFAANALNGFYKVLNNELPIFEMEYPCHSPNEQRWFLLRITKFADDSPKVVMMHIDITARVKAGTIMHETLERYDILTKATSDTIWDWDIIKNKITYNNVITDMFGYKTSSIENLVEWWKKSIHPDDLPIVSESLEKVFNNKLHNFQLEYRFKCEDGSYKDVFDRAFVIFDNNDKPIRMIGAMQDITDRKRTENEFKAMKRALMNQKIQEQKKITRAILNAQEKERRHMGEELHDNINQMLAGTKLYLSVAGNSKNELKEALQYPIELIDETMHEIRLLTRRSTTPKQNINLKELVHSLLETLDKNTSIKTSFAYSVATDFNDDDLKLNIYRILQEQTNNIMKHADAANVNIALETSSNVIYIEVKDDGKGFNVNKKREGIGLSNIINRVESFNGKVVIQSTQGKGCKLQITIPY